MFINVKCLSSIFALTRIILPSSVLCIFIRANFNLSLKSKAVPLLVVSLDLKLF